MVAVVASIVVSLLMSGAIMWYAGKRPVGTPVSWGEAMLGSAYIFFLVFILYGVVPHQWLTLAENELGWRADKFFHGPFELFKPQNQGGFFPMDITYRAISDTVATVIYVVFIGGQIVFFAKWQNRGRDADAKALAVKNKRTTYGRPLVKQG